MKKAGKLLFLIVSALLLAVPMLATNLKPDQTSEIDNRKLQEFPALKIGGFREGVEAYLSDRIGFRRDMITAYQEFCDVAYHKLVHPSYIYGKNDYVMAPWDLVTYQHLDVSEEYIEDFTDYVASLQQLCTNQGAEFLFYLCPNKETIYPEFFPDGYNIKDQPNRTDRILEQLDEKDVPYLYPKELFMSLKEDNQLYNVKYDAGHWNETGAFYGQQQVIHYFNQTFPAMGELSQDEFDITQVLQEYLPSSRFKIDEMVPNYSLRQTDAVSVPEVFDQITVTAPNQYHLYYENETAMRNGAPKILIFGDSYLEVGEKFYLNHCAELTKLHAENMPNSEYYISVFQPDIVIYEVVERQLQSSWDTYKSTKRYYSLSELQDHMTEPGVPFAEQISIDAEMESLQFQAKTQEFVSFSGNLDGTVENPSNVMTLIAVLNGKEYYPIFDQESLSYQFTFRTEDLVQDTGISFYAVRMPTD